MTERDEEKDSGELTPPEIGHTHLPDQTMYKVELDEADRFAQSDGIRTYPVFMMGDRLGGVMDAYEIGRER